MFKANNDEIIKIRGENIVHALFKGRCGITEAKEDCTEFECFILGSECSFAFVTRFYAHLVAYLGKVNLGEKRYYMDLV